MANNLYPQLNIRSKNELAKRISGRQLPYDQALALINDVLENYDDYWVDFIKKSEPEKEKWVRDASKTKLGKLLKLIDDRLLKPHDSRVPNFIFGGVSKMNHKAAVTHLLGTKRKRVLLKLDITRFFEQIHEERVFYLFHKKMGCGKAAARILSRLCCVPIGQKEEPGDIRSIARGFSTSPRLAVWSNLETFIKVERFVLRRLKGRDPRIAIYVDDIGITASRATLDEMRSIYPKLKHILEEADKNQKLPLNEKKTQIVFHTGKTFGINGHFKRWRGFEHLGIQMLRNKLTTGHKTRWKTVNITQAFEDTGRTDKGLKKRRKSLLRYKDYIRR